MLIDARFERVDNTFLQCVLFFSMATVIAIVGLTSILLLGFAVACCVSQAVLQGEFGVIVLSNFDNFSAPQH